MLVLKIIAGITLLWLIYWSITTLNNKVWKKFKYNFFDSSNFVLAFISNLFIYFGREWYLEVLEKGGDLLNGMVLMGIGGIGLLLLIFLNIKGTNFIVGVVGSMIQLALFGIASFFAVFIVMLAIAFFANARPVYNIND